MGGLQDPLGPGVLGLILLKCLAISALHANMTSLAGGEKSDTRRRRTSTALPYEAEEPTQVVLCGLQQGHWHKDSE